MNKIAVLAMAALLAGWFRSGTALAGVSVASPDGALTVSLDVDHAGVPRYRVSYRDETVIHPSRLGLRFRARHGLDESFALTSSMSVSADKTWEQPWGERRFVRDHHNDLAATFTAEGQTFTVRVRVFNDGLGLRYEVPAQGRPKAVFITDELTEFRMETGSTSWWIPTRGWNRYEYLYNATPVEDIDRAHTPITIRTKSGVHFSIHEAALVDYAGMSLDQKRPGVFKADLAPRSDGTLVRKEGAFTTPWRTIQIAPDAVGLLNSDLILNLNEPNTLGDVSWVEPGKYIGIWWAMHIRDRTWGRDGIHGATTEEARRYIDFAAEHGFDGVLVEGWNIGWDGNWYENGDVFSFTESYPDFDLQAVTDHALARGVRLIGHHETSGNITNYENQMADAYALYEKHGVRQIKSGYVADGGAIKRLDENGIAFYEWHDGQVMANHHLKAVRAAAKYKLSLNPHEPIKDTGLRRTYPNWITREGARGQEYNAWGIPPNPPEHTAILPFTRMLSGPMDFTPGIFDLRPNERPPVRADLPRPDTRSRVETTLAKQLALYVVIYSPIQMAADIPENYEARPEPFQFIKDVPTDWEESIALAGEIGDYVVFARKERATTERRGADWYLGGLTDETGRTLTVPLSFLDDGVTYTAQIYRDGKGAHWETAPYEIAIERRRVTSRDRMDLPLAPGGGIAIRFEADAP